MPAFAALEIASDTALAIKPDTARLAQDPYWLRLLQNPNPQLAQAELLDNQAAFAIAATDDNSPACRYPARRAWLAEQRPDWAAQWPTPVCPALKRWLDAIDAQQATLVFASDYLNNPSSMFGHTLLRIDAKTQTDDTRLLAYAVNYAAQTNTSNGLEFAIKGLTGGYPGKFSLLPYYEKVKEYNDWESRDLWEYELDLTPAEVHRLLLTYWDWRDTTAPYYFLSKNCSYALLGLLEMARPGLRLQAQFPAQAIPTDTLRAVLAEPHMLRRMTWRPASGTRRNAAIERNPRAVNQAVKSLIDLDAPLPASLELAPEQQAQAFETAYDELYARYLARQVPKDIAPPRLRNLLTLRSQVDIPDQRVAPAQPAADPSQGHGTARWGIGAGHDDESMALLSYRGAYHDWLDPQAGYREGARIDFLTGTLRINKDGKVGVQDATVVAIDSLAPASVLQQPLSWSLRVGADHVLGDRRDADSHTVAVIEGGAGNDRLGGVYRLDKVQSAITGGDGKEMLATDHPTLSGNQSNEMATSADLSEAALETILTQIMLAKNDRGLQIGIRPQKLIVDPTGAFEAERIIKSNLQNDTANNAVNAVKSMGLLPGGIVVNHYLTDTDAWFVKTNVSNGLMMFQRTPYEFTQDNDFDTMNAKAKGYERYSVGWTDWRSLFGSPGV